MLNLPSYQENTNQNHKNVSPQPCQNIIHAGAGVGKGELLHTAGRM